MANRFPLIIDTSDNNKLKELPVGDNLDLSGSGVVNAGSIQTTGSITAGSLNVNGQDLASVALTGNFDDLVNTPVAFTGAYNDLTGKPTIPTTTRALTDVQDVEPSSGDVLQWNSLLGRFEPTAITVEFDISQYALQELSNVVVPGAADNKYLKYYAGAWRAANVTYAEVQNSPTALSEFTNDVGFITAETDSQTLSFDGENLSISNGNTVALTALLDDQTLTLNGTELTINSGNTVDLAGIVGDTVGNFTFASSVIDTDDSSAITVTPAVVMSSDLTVENDLTIRNDLILEGTITGDGSGTPELFSDGDLRLTADTVIIDGNFQITGQIETTGTGTPELVSDTDIHLTAGTRVEITSSPFKVASFTTAQRDALTPEVGDIIFNAETGTFQGYIISVVDSTQKWVNLSPEE